MLDDLAIKLRQNVGFVTAILLFCVLYLLYNLAHPKGFSSAVLVQNADEIFALAMLAMAQTVPVLMSGLDLSVGAAMTMVGCFASYLLAGTVGGTPLHLEIFGMYLGLGTFPGGTSGILLGITAWRRDRNGRRLHQWVRRRLWTHPSRSSRRSRPARSISASRSSCVRRPAARSTRISTGH